jgi:putative flavoprotein involved in K+ transport
MDEKIETLIIGAGSAGLSLSYYLAQMGREHLVLEKSSQVADAWRNRRWDSFTLVTPNWTFRLPGADLGGVDPAGFMGKSEIVRRFEQYEQENHLPVRYNTEVKRVHPFDGPYRYRVFTNGKTYLAKDVVIATGMFQKVKVPAFAAQIPSEITQLTSDAYRNPYDLPPGRVLVVGSAQSGCQIAEELNQAGRKVYLSTSAAGRLPRTYRGMDGFDWLNRVGFFDRTPEMLNSPMERRFIAPHLTGKAGGHTINLHQFCRDGIVLLGHTIGYEDGKLGLAPDLAQNLSKADGFAKNAISQFDAYIEKNALDLPIEEILYLEDGFHLPVTNHLDLKAEGVETIIWATGYLQDYSMFELPLLDAYGFPDAKRGVSRHPGVYFIGVSWMEKFKTGLLFGIAEAAHDLAGRICA